MSRAGAQGRQRRPSGRARTEAATAPSLAADRGLGHQRRDGDEVHDAEGKGDEEREGEGRNGVERVEGHQGARGECPDAIALLSTALPALSPFSISASGFRGERRVDVPGLERPAVQRAVDAHQERRRAEDGDRSAT